MYQRPPRLLVAGDSAGGTRQEIPEGAGAVILSPASVAHTTPFSCSLWDGERTEESQAGQEPRGLDGLAVDVAASSMLTDWMRSMLPFEIQTATSCRCRRSN
ncbi:unnamed protein product [Ectocarpus sp. CCAP 1310/34]|nr:unnamed protein product [Ectocarpus sp. CCAP 1310/34]